MIGRQWPYALIGLGVLIIIMTPAWIALLRPTVPLTYPRQPIPVQADRPIVAGKPVPLLIERCNQTRDSLTYSYVHNLRRVDTTPSTVTLLMAGNGLVDDPGCDTVLTLLNVIPANTPPGRYTITSVAVVEDGGHLFRIPWQTEEFEVMAE